MKRQADVQITKDGRVQGEEERNPRDSPPPDVPQQASQNVLSRRKIAAMPRRRGADSTTYANPFDMRGEEVKANGDAKEVPEYTRLLKQRGLNSSFKEAVESACRADAFTDLTSVCNSYVKHVVEILSSKRDDHDGDHGAKPISFGESMASKGNDGANKSKLFSFGESKPTEAVGEGATPPPVFTFGAASVEPDNRKEQQSALKPFALTPFSFGDSAGGDSTVKEAATGFSFGGAKKPLQQSEKMPVDEEAPKSSNVPTFVFNLPSSDQQPASTWTPDKGIKFGSTDGTTAATTEENTVNSNKTPAFRFNNPLAQPSSTPSEQQPKPFSSTGFDFGSGAGKPAPSTAAPPFSFGAPPSTSSHNPFGASTTTPSTFSFNKPVAEQTSEKATPLYPFLNTAADNANTSAEASEAESTGETAVDRDKEADGEPSDEVPPENTGSAQILNATEGEEDEDQVYSVRAKVTVQKQDLGRHHGEFSKESESESGWTTIGVGELRLNVHRTTKKARLICRGEGAFAPVFLNVRLYPNFKYQIVAGSTRTVSLPRIDDRNGIINYNILVKSPQDAQILASKMEEFKA